MVKHTDGQGLVYRNTCHQQQTMKSILEEFSSDLRHWKSL